MAHTMRHATLVDLIGMVVARRRFHVLRLNPPYTLLHPDAMLYDLLRSQLPVNPKISYVYVYSERGVVQGYVQARCRWRRRDEWTITTLGMTDRAPEEVQSALLEEVVRGAGYEGVIRLFAKVPEDEAMLTSFRRLGFTQYTHENIWGNLYFAPRAAAVEDAPAAPLRSQTNRDAWDLMQLYSAVTPQIVQRAEALNSRQWQISRIPRPWFLSQGMLQRPYVWPDLGGDSHRLGGYIRLLTEARGHWITMLFRPDQSNRAFCASALEYTLARAARFGNKPVYCGVREYQSELEGLLEGKGFHMLSRQALLVKYLAEPIEERQPALVPFLVPKRGDAVSPKYWS